MNKPIERYQTELSQQLLPFWKKAIDTEYGGVYTCFSNDGAQLISKRKYIWSQGRFLWIACKLQQLQNENRLTDDFQWNRVAKQTYEFLRKNALMDNRHVVFAVERDGRHIADQMDTSIFADCFYVLGCNAYADLQQDKQVFEHAYAIYQKINNRIDHQTFKSDPYPIPKGYTSHSIAMILLNVAQELYITATSFSKEYEQALERDQLILINRILDEFVTGSRIKELKHSQAAGDTLLERHINPGHTLESVWFMLHSLQGLQQEKQETITKIEEVAKQALELGWDQQDGGLFRFIDHLGGEPTGILIDTPYEQLIHDTWNLKLWWPHAEALYTTKLLESITGKTEWTNYYEQIERYALATFPQTDPAIREWIQIRSRDGTPLEKVVALPVKDPFHIIRSFILLIELQERKK
ncbi:AGE family epimerase/isomerase [Gracilibacillus phocaeensis]|uniref:AGE family epimerase/isomerase n=1 Tax=Gracilibacillus phocaeensis TaxID=2042304 RepID=UPI00103184A6|nr:AGE family epimerase/isomerase [Gracilibacillus phocaeensis]